MLCERFHKPFAQIRRTYGLRTKGHLFEEFEGDWVFLLDPPEIFPVSENPRVRIVGPVYYRPAVASEDIPNVSKSQRATIAITLGSTGDLRAFRFLEKLDLTRFHDVILIGGPACGLNIPGALRLSFSDLSTIASRSDVVICHGGNGTVYSFLSKGVPAVMIPSHIEQYWFSYQIHKMGLGEICKQRDRSFLGVLERWIHVKRSGVLERSAVIFDLEESLRRFRSYIRALFMSIG